MGSSGDGHPVTVKLPASIDDLPYFLPSPKESHWASSHARIWIQTDNQQIAEIFAGRSTLMNDSLRPVGVRISRSMLRFVRRGRKPRTETSDLIEWDPREMNTIADHAANQAIDQGCDWDRHYQEGIQECMRKPVNFRVCVDGALRGDGAAGAGMAVFAYHIDGARSMLYMAGRPLGRLKSAFVAEAMAMEWCLDKFEALLIKVCGVSASSGT